MEAIIKAARGTSDILLDKAVKKSRVEQRITEIFERFGYSPIITPIFEHTELFTRTIGEATDIVSKEMYTFKDKGGRSLTLRPEGTAPVIRAFLEHGLTSMPMPVKLYYSGQMFRYERPQAGRYREFYQIGVEAIGSSDPLIDAENIFLLHYALTELGLSELILHLNSMGCKGCRKDFVASLQKDLKEGVGDLCDDCRLRAASNPLRVFDCKNPNCIESLKTAPKIGDYLCKDCKDHFDVVRGALSDLEIDFIVDSSLVRGFDYYTKTTFEVRSAALGAQNALGGGGRYDGLAEELGGPHIPSIGFAIGTERVLLALQALDIPLSAGPSPDLFIISTDEARREAFKMLMNLRKAGLSAEMDYGLRTFKGQMKLAGKMGAAFVIILGEQELAKGMVSIKSMADGEQTEVLPAGAAAWLLKNLNRSEEV